MTLVQFGRLIPIALALAVNGCDRGPVDAGTEATAASGGGTVAAAGMAIPDAARRELGITLVALEAARFQETVDGFGLVVPLQDIVQPLADLVSAEAAARTSQAALERARGLYNDDAGVSREVLQAAELKAISDQEQRALAKVRAVAAAGRGAPWLDTERRADVLAALNAGESELVAASFPGGLDTIPPASLTVRRIGDPARDPARQWRTETVWTGPSRPGVPGLTVFGYIDDARGLVQGERVSAAVPTAGVSSGVIVPAAAIVFAGGETWCFTAGDGDLLVRVTVDLGRPVAGGYFVTGGLAPGDRVVTRGAGLLLARETGGGD